MITETEKKRLERGRFDKKKDWSLIEVLKWSTGYFEGKGIISPRLNSELLLGKVLALSRIELYLQHDRPLVPDELARIREVIRLRATRYPLQFILGCVEFIDLHLSVGEGVFVPRPETEVLAQRALEHGRTLSEGERGESLRILDLGTGSGAIGLYLASHLLGASVTVTDISKTALAYVRANARKNGLGNISAIMGNLFEPFDADRDLLFDLIVSNPPYIPSRVIPRLEPEVSRYEPKAALDGGTDGQEVIGRIIDEAPSFLREGAWLILEVGDGQAAGVKQRMEERFSPVEIERDLSGIPRVVLGKASADMRDSSG